MVWVNHRDLDKAHDRWLEAWPCPLVCDWPRFLGHQYLPPGRLNERNIVYWDLSEEAAHRIRLILTPHYKALLKAMAVQYVETIF